MSNLTFNDLVIYFGKVRLGLNEKVIEDVLLSFYSINVIEKFACNSQPQDHGKP